MEMNGDFRKFTSPHCNDISDGAAIAFIWQLCKVKNSEDRQKKTDLKVNALLEKKQSVFQQVRFTEFSNIKLVLAMKSLSLFSECPAGKEAKRLSAGEIHGIFKY